MKSPSVLRLFAGRLAVLLASAALATSAAFAQATGSLNGRVSEETFGQMLNGI